VQKLEKDFNVLDLQHVPSANNAVTDELLAKASSWALVPNGVFKWKLQQPIAWPAEPGETSTLKLVVPTALFPWSPPSIVGVTGDFVHSDAQDPEAQVSPDAWIMEIQTYLKDNILPDDSASADRIVRLTKRYMLVEGDLYQRGANGILIRCITWEEGYELLAEVHGGKCGNHASSRMLVGKAFRHGFYWPTSLQDAIKLVKTCRACQFHRKQIHTSMQSLQMILPSWPFAVWGLDNLGSFPRVVGGYWYLYVAIDKFTK
jgi:hypothetical protein